MLDLTVTADVLRSVRKARDHFLALWMLDRMLGRAKATHKLLEEVQHDGRGCDREMDAPDFDSDSPE